MRRVVKNMFLLFVLLGAVVFTTPVFTSGPNISGDLGLGATAGASKAGSETLQNKVSSSIPQLLGDVIGVVLGFLGVIFFILTLYAGFTWMLARGKEEYTKKAKDTLVAAVIGLLIVFGSYAITQFVFKAIEDEPAPAPQAVNPEGAAVCNQNAYNQCVGACNFINCNAQGVNCDNNFQPRNIDQACLMLCANNAHCEELLRR